MILRNLPRVPPPAHHIVPEFYHRSASPRNIGALQHPCSAQQTTLGNIRVREKEQDARTVPEGQGCEAGTGEFGDGGEVEAAEGGGEGVEEEGGEGEGEGWEEGEWHCGSWSGWSDWGGEAGWVTDGWG